MEFSKGAFTAMRGGALGDFALTLPALAALRNAAALRLIGDPRFLWMARPDAILDHDSPALLPLYSGAGPLPPLTAPFFAECDLFLAYAVDPDHSLAARLRSFVRGEVLVHNPHPPRGIHITDHLLAPLCRLGVPVPDPVPRLCLRPEERAYARSCWQERQLRPPLVVVHPGSGGRRKCWPLSCFLELARRLGQRGFQVLIPLGPAEEDLVGRVPGELAVQPPGLAELASLLEGAALFVGNDAGPGHLAAALDTPTLTLFGPTDPCTWRPRHPRSRIIQAPDGRLEALAAEAVLEVALEMLRAPRGDDGRSLL